MTPTPAWTRWLLSEYFVLALSVLYFLLLLPVTPGLASPQNLANLFSGMLPLLIVAIGQTIVLITGGIDLSVTSTVALVSTAGALVMSGDRGLLAGSPWAVPAALAVMLLLGPAIGALNGVAITALRMPPFIVTLTTMMFLSGFAIWLTSSQNVYRLPPAFSGLARQGVVALAIAAAVALAAHALLSGTRLGRWLYAVGRNARTSLVSGVPVNRTIVAAYVLSGFCAAVAAILYTARLETGSPTMGQRILLDVIGAAVIGGTSLFGGQGKVAWTACGVLFMALVDNSLNLLGLSSFAILMAKGLVILTAALLDRLRRTYAAR